MNESRENTHLSNHVVLDNKTIVWYPRGMKMTEGRKKALNDFTTFLADNFGQEVDQVFFNPDLRRNDQLHAVKLTFKKQGRENDIRNVQ